uniref:Uncharacterized protein n=1 Tax=Oryza rufipogon TaxID=4529 RepID=A0A0E0R6I3_ORYRU
MNLWQYQRRLAEKASEMIVAREQRRGCRCAGGDGDDESGDAVVQRDDTVVAPCQCSGEKSIGDEVMLRRAPLSTATTNRGGPRAVALKPERVTQRQPGASWRRHLMMIICGSHCSQALEWVIKSKICESEG